MCESDSYLKLEAPYIPNFGYPLRILSGANSIPWIGICFPKTININGHTSFCSD